MDELYHALLFVNGSVPADSIFSSYNVSVNGMWVEGNIFVKKQMEEKGVWRRLYRKMPEDIATLTVGTLLLYGLDKGCGIEHEMYNFHRGWAYGWGAFKYFQGGLHFMMATDTVVTDGLEKLVRYCGKDRSLKSHLNGKGHTAEGINQRIPRYPRPKDRGFK